MILWPYYLHNGISYTGKMVFLDWIGAKNGDPYISLIPSKVLFDKTRMKSRAGVTK